MTTAYTSLLGLALPVTGELSGTWGDTVNNSITSLLDDAIAGTTTLSTDADVTLSNNDGTADTSRQAILLWTAGGTVTRTIIAPALSKIYTVINASSSTQSIKVTGPGPTTGVTIIKGEAAMIAWNGSDFVKVSNTGGSFTTQDLTVTGNTILGDAITDTTTLNAQTRFQSRAILGYANMTGPASTSLTTTAPAFLYSGATTYTVSDVSGGTQAFAPVISLGQATITNATTNTIYTNAATLYIAGAPNAGTNITLTNPYALYIAAGASYLGGNTAVTGTLSATGVATFSAGTAALPAITTSGDTNTGIWFPAADTIAFTEGGVESMRIDASGNLGIGVTSPVSILDVNAKGTGTTPNAVKTYTSYMHGSTIGTNVGELTGWGVRYGTIAATPVWYGARFLKNGVNAASDFTIWTSPDGDVTTLAERVTVTASGNLGIGNTSPASYNAAADNLVIGTSGSNGLTIVSGTTNDGSIHFADGTSGADAYRGQIFYSHAANYMVFSTNATERMRIDSSGNVGIGTSSPAVTLSVAGTIGVFGGSLNVSLGSPQLYRPVSDTLAIATGAVERMRIDSSGNLGLGATSITPRDSGARTLELYGASSGRAAIKFTNSTSGTGATDGMFLGYDDNLNFVILNNESGVITLGTNNAERARFDSSGVFVQKGATTAAGIKPTAIANNESITTVNSTTYTINLGTSAKLFWIALGNGDGALVFTSYISSSITFLGITPNNVVATASPSSTQLGISKSANSHDIVIKTGSALSSTAAAWQMGVLSSQVA